MRHAQAMGTHMLDMRGPGVDERHILACLHHMRPGIAAHGTGTDDRYPFTHCAYGSLRGFSRIWRQRARNLARLQRRGQVLCEHAPK